MDVPRAGVAAKKRKRRVIIIAASALGLILATIAISRLKPAVPSVDRSTVWIDTVKRGPMVRQVRGLGTLRSEEHTSELQSPYDLVCRLLLEKKKKKRKKILTILKYITTKNNSDHNTQLNTSQYIYKKYNRRI